MREKCDGTMTVAQGAYTPALLAAFVAGVFLLQQQPALPPTWVMVFVLVWVGCAVGVALRWPRTALVAGVMASAALGFVYAAAVAQWRLADELAWADEGRDVRVTGVVSSLPAPTQHGVRFEFDVEQVHTPDIHVPTHIALSWYGRDVMVMPAERWSFTVRLRRPHGSFNPGGFDSELWMLERGLRATGYVRGPAVRVEAKVAQVGPRIDRLRHELRLAMQQALGTDRYAGVLIALVLGDQRAISAQDWALFNQTGISHLVSISGLHITMIAGLAAWGVSALWRRSRRALTWAPAQSAAAVAAVLAALGYCLLAGWGVPAQRTFFMLTVVASALMARRALRPTTILAVAAAVVCLLDPWSVMAAGFWLSFGAVAAIMWAMNGRVRASATAPSWRERLLDATRVQLAVTVALIPLTIALFAQLSLIGPLANTVAIPVVSLVVTPLALVGAALVMLPEPLSSLAAPLLTLAHQLFAWLAHALQVLVQLPAASVPWPVPPAWALVCALLGVAWLLAPRGWPVRWAGALWLLPLVVWPPLRPAADELWVTALDVGQGTAVLVQTHQAALLFDTGPRYTPQTDAGSRIIAPYLRRHGISPLDVMVVSHLDSDHSGGAASVMKEISVARVLTSIDADSPVIQGAKKTERCVAGQSGALGEATWRMLHPTSDNYTQRLDTNSLSCVMMITWGQQRVLLTGDVPSKQEAHMLAREGADALRPTTLLIAAHHGSHTSSSPAWIAATQPQWVAYTVGYRNRYGHPHAEVAQRFAAAGTHAVRTDQAGATTWRLRADGRVDVERSRVLLGRYWHNRAPAVEKEDEDAVEDAVDGGAVM